MRRLVIFLWLCCSLTRFVMVGCASATLSSTQSMRSCVLCIHSMSGAEAIVAFGIATNVIQFVEFTAKLCSRIREYASGSGLPKKLATQADRLADLLQILKSLDNSSNQGVLGDQTLARCQIQAQELSDFLDDLKSHGQRQSWAKNAKRAFKSLNRSDQIEELQGVLDSLVANLNLQLQADTR